MHKPKGIKIPRFIIFSIFEDIFCKFLNLSIIPMIQAGMIRIVETIIKMKKKNIMKIVY